jgi:transcriptional regulator with GAF, ATPase, and Fis domain
MVEDLGSRNGTLVNGEEVDRRELKDGDVLEMGHTFLLYRELPAPPEPAPLDQEGTELVDRAQGLATLQPLLAHQLQLFERIARSELGVLVRGESGTGKELAAAALHKLSGRPGPFQPVNCGALPSSLVESELFGYKRGAFTGATDDRAGLVRAADRGTLFLDEIGDLPLTAQAALLRMLQESEVQPIGATQPQRVDVRVVAATHRDLESMVAAQTFRADLLARLSGYTLRLPPLRERREDLGLLVPALLERHAAGRARELRLHTSAARALLLHKWPFNVRELEKLLSAALVLSSDGSLRLDHFPGLSSTPTPDPDGEPPQKLTPEEEELKRRIEELLAQHGGNITAVARAMGKARVQLQRWIKRFRIDMSKYRR